MKARTFLLSLTRWRQTLGFHQPYTLACSSNIGSVSLTRTRLCGTWFASICWSNPLVSSQDHVGFIMAGCGCLGLQDRVSDLGDDLHHLLQSRRMWDSGGSIRSLGLKSATPPFIFSGLWGLRIGWVTIYGDTDHVKMWFLVRRQLVSLFSEGTLLALWLLDVLTQPGCSRGESTMMAFYQNLVVVAAWWVLMSSAAVRLLAWSLAAMMAGCLP